ncbi:hypothetical protein SBRCBS47491_004093 [Sporothrix bragantina]|uniref:Uncharacterized protein n=1 Tax=Sporothrix bragantina TaxID=671064 RepID=A0ABP0BL23_9PEZI
MASFPNVYTHRKVAEGSAKGCDVCYKPTTSVLITPENKVSRERTFCTPIVDKAAEEAKKKKAEEEKEAKMKEEIERVKKEYEEKQKKKKEKKDEEKEAEKDKDKEKEKDKKDDKDKDDKDKKKDEKDSETPAASDEPRVFALQKFLYQQRLDKKRQAEIAKRNRERLTNPSFFPSVPKGLP